MKYWHLKIFLNKSKDNYSLATKKLDNLVKTSTQQRMFSDVSTGTFLSGGMIQVLYLYISRYR